MKILSRTVRKARGKHCARLRYIDDDRKKHELLRTAESKAKTKLAQLETELTEKGRDWRPVRLRLDSLLNTRSRGSTNPLLTMGQEVKSVVCEALYLRTQPLTTTSLLRRQRHQKVRR